MSGMSADRRLHVTVLSPDGLLVASLDEPSGQINFQTQETGIPVIPLQCHIYVSINIIVQDSFLVIIQGFSLSLFLMALSQYDLFLAFL